MAATIYDVAKLAGVGLGTVSRVLNNSTAVKTSTRQRVQEAIRQLNYIPNPTARNMIWGRTGSLAVIVPSFSRPFSVEILRGIEAGARLKGFELLIYNIESEAGRDETFKRLAISRKVDGLLIVSLLPEASYLDDFKRANLPTVLVDAYHPDLSSVAVNTSEGTYQGLKYLLDLGHRRVGFINEKTDEHINFNPTQDRLNGFCRALKEAGMKFEPELVEIADGESEGGRWAARRLLKLETPPTALLVASDIQALGVLETAWALRLNVPGDLSILGGGGIKIAEWLELSTVQHPLYQMGELGLTQLVQQLENPPSQTEPTLTLLNPHLLIRNTTARPG